MVEKCCIKRLERFCFTRVGADLVAGQRVNATEEGIVKALQGVAPPVRPRCLSTREEGFDAADKSVIACVFEWVTVIEQ